MSSTGHIMCFFFRIVHLLLHYIIISWKTGTWTEASCLHYYKFGRQQKTTVHSVQKVAVSHIRYILTSVFPLQFNLHSHTHLYSVLCTPTHTVHAHWAEVMRWDGSCFVIQWGKTVQVSIPHSCTASRPYRRTTIWGHVELAAVIKCDVL